MKSKATSEPVTRQASEGTTRIKTSWWDSFLRAFKTRPDHKRSNYPSGRIPYPPKKGPPPPPAGQRIIIYGGSASGKSPNRLDITAERLVDISNAGSGERTYIGCNGTM